MHSQPDGPGGPSRRAFLIAGGTAVIAGAGAGVGIEFTRHETRRRASTPPPPPPAELADALAAERDLIAVLDASIATEPQLGERLTRIRADHAAHERALAAAKSSPNNYRAHSTTASSSKRLSACSPHAPDSASRTSSPSSGPTPAETECDSATSPDASSKAPRPSMSRPKHTRKPDQP